MAWIYHSSAWQTSHSAPSWLESTIVLLGKPVIWLHHGLNLPFSPADSHLWAQSCDLAAIVSHWETGKFVQFIFNPDGPSGWQMLDSGMWQSSKMWFTLPIFVLGVWCLWKKKSFGTVFLVPNCYSKWMIFLTLITFLGCAKLSSLQASGLSKFSYFYCICNNNNLLLHVIHMQRRQLLILLSKLVAWSLIFFPRYLCETSCLQEKMLH
jgi:hypothetical protein